MKKTPRLLLLVPFYCQFLAVEGVFGKQKQVKVLSSPSAERASVFKL